MSRPDVTELPPHAPERGWSHRLLGAFHVTGLFWYRFHRWAMGFLPSWGVGPIILIFTALFFVTLRKIRRALADNLVPVLGPCGWFERQRRIWRSMHAFAWCLSERYERLVTARQFDIIIDTARWRSIGDSPSGHILVTAHLGNFEVGSMLPASREGRDVHVVREPEVDPAAQEFVRSTLEGAGGIHYKSHFESGDWTHATQLLDALREGAIVGVQGDRPRAGGRTIDGTLFERPFSFPEGPIALARLAEVPLVPVFVFREGRRRYHVQIEPEIRVPQTGNRRADLAQATQELAAALERGIRHRPYQWFCFRTVFDVTRRRSTLE